ncbi:hypothetical protein IGI39_002642 [Enterococcus sp. AZ135]|uniref:DUF2922 family protein n=1 Tax=unclassified Enterococcus TaxID=2608891 RepID=UPI003F242708
MTHDLVATFMNSLGRKHNWTYKGVDNDLPDATLKEACELLTSLDIFEQNGVKLFESVVTAKVVTTIEKEIFDVALDTELAVQNTLKQPAQNEQPITALEANKPALVKTEQKRDSQVPRTTTIEAKTAKRMTLSPIVPLPSVLISAPRLPKTTIQQPPAVKIPESIQQQPDTMEQPNTQKGFLAWIRRKKHRNKDDPDLHCGDPKSES